MSQDAFYHRKASFFLTIKTLLNSFNQYSPTIFWFKRYGPNGSLVIMRPVETNIVLLVFILKTRHDPLAGMVGA